MSMNFKGPLQDGHKTSTEINRCNYSLAKTYLEFAPNFSNTLKNTFFFHEQTGDIIASQWNLE